MGAEGVPGLYSSIRALQPPGEHALSIFLCAHALEWWQ